MQLEFVTWDMLTTFSSLISITYIVTQFTKDVIFIKMIKTKYYSAIVAALLIVSYNVKQGSFISLDLILYFLSAIIVSMAANGLHDFGAKPTNVLRKGNYYNG